MATAPTANITVNAEGKVSAVVLVTAGTGVDLTTVLSATAASIGGTGEGFSIPVATVTAGNNNNSLGYRSLYECQTGSGNLCLGHESGYHELGSNKLYIANTSTTEPLIWGDFSAQELRFYTTKFAVNGNTPVAKAAAIASPPAELAALKTAVDALREVVKTNGFTA